MGRVVADTAPLFRITTPELYLEVASRLRNRIYSQGLNPGEVIDELAIAEECGISRTPMREALKIEAKMDYPAANYGVVHSSLKKIDQRQRASRSKGDRR